MWDLTNLYLVEEINKVLLFISEPKCLYYTTGIGYYKSYERDTQNCLVPLYWNINLLLHWNCLPVPTPWWYIWYKVTTNVKPLICTCAIKFSVSSKLPCEMLQTSGIEYDQGQCKVLITPTANLWYIPSIYDTGVPNFTTSQFSYKIQTLL